MVASVTDHDKQPISETRADTPTLDKSGSRVREMFRQIAPRYDAMNHLLSLSIDRYWRWRTVRQLRIKEDLPVLDTCTGTGDLAIAIAKKSPISVSVIGSDFCHAMLEIARRKRSPKTSSESIEFIEADSQALPFPENTFQCVTVAFGLRNVTDTDQGLREMTRVSVPGGQVVVLEFSQPRMIGLKQLYGFYFRNVLPRIGQWFARNDKSAYTYLPESVGQFPDGQALADRMIAAGLRDVQFTPLTFGVATIYQGTKPTDGEA
ncbi:UbiE/COQ5 methyltransferase [Planctomycetes bacterium CA13]|uniref:Demethylmenaquinone methyltransferase n=1 Tax=Novipirellula herctigrandis TaxID=2527986 RepID=A0A5C5Z859_9BACT|nr:UbiE/COQ5 methyltransferase [Planctomycetes bacterium CA13]